MISKAKELHNRFFRLDKVDVNCLPFYSAAKFTLIFGLFAHIAYVIFFAWLHIGLLVTTNIIGAIGCFYCILKNNKGHFILCVTLSAVNTIINTSLAILIMGWDCGFQLFLLFAAAAIFFCPTLRIRIKGLFAVLACCLFLGLKFTTNTIPPLVSLNDSILSFTENLNILVLFCIIIIMSYSYSKYTNLSVQKLHRTYNSLRNLANTDPLTSLPNRRAMSNMLDTEINRYARSKKTFVLILCDIDNFKAINDSYGHDCGDHVLTEVSALMSRLLRRQDIVARWGGEEFLILLPESDLEAGRIVAEKLRNEISNATFHYDEHDIKITMTFGISLYDHAEETKDVIKRADKALYFGKSNGKNRIAYF
jgi:diguanylate cyclase (GGDEF)-like protein